MLAVGAGRQAAARHRRRLAAPSLRLQAQNHIHHGQARAEDEDVVLGPDAVQRPRRPGIGQDARALSRRSGARGGVAGGQNHGAALDAATIGEEGCSSVSGDGLSFDLADQVRADGPDGLQPVLDIEAVKQSRSETFRIGAGGRVFLQPVDEVPWPVDNGAHPLRTDVQSVFRQRRRIGHAGAEDLAALDQDRGLPAFGQPRGQHGAGKAAADDDHGQKGGVVHRVTTPEPSRRVKGIQIS